MYIKRLIDNDLNAFRGYRDRMPILIRGARQIGKSSSVRNFGKNFTKFVEINFDQKPNYALVFEKDLDAHRICQELSLLAGIEIEDEKTLLFFDEIQLAPKAISCLRYFYEQRPRLHVIATGSLLDFALGDLPSFGLGRVQSLYMHSFNFF